VFRAGDVLYGKLRPYLNKVAIPDFDGVCSTDILVFRPSRDLHNRFLYHLLRQHSVVEYAVRHASGINLPRVSFNALAELPVALPPLSEQRRIAERIDALRTRSHASREQIQPLPRLVQDYRQSLLAAAFRGDLTADWRAQNPHVEPASVLVTSRNASKIAGGRKPARTQFERQELLFLDEEIVLPATWVWASIDQLADVVRGASPRPAGDTRFFHGDHTPWITVGELTKDDDIYLVETTSRLTSEGRARSRFIEPGTLLLTNSGATLGVPKITRIGGCINDGSVALLGVDGALQLYLYFYLRGLTARLRGINQGAAQPNLNTDIVRNIAVPLPPLDEQVQIVRALMMARSRAKALTGLVSEGVADLDRLNRSILSQAFRGELVPQDPNDEPASVLLERIRAERAAEGGGKPRRGRRKASA
jgi:type I restriction enzyme S subunit